jgi:thioredoxin 1
MKEINSKDFEQEVTSQHVAVVKYWAAWCTSCITSAPIVDEVAESVNIPFVSINTDEYKDFAKSQGVKAIPVLHFFKDGRKREMLLGDKITKENIEQKLRMIGALDEIKSEEIRSESNHSD